jgi:hypothetical protein
MQQETTSFCILESSASKKAKVSLPAREDKVSRAHPVQLKRASCLMELVIVFGGV